MTGRQTNTKAKNCAVQGYWVDQNYLGALVFDDCNGNGLYVQITTSGTINKVIYNGKTIFAL